MQDEQTPINGHLLSDPIVDDIDFENLSNDRRLNKLLKSVLGEVKLYAEDQIKHIKQLTQIGLALSSEKDIGKLLEARKAIQQEQQRRPVAGRVLSQDRQRAFEGRQP